MANPSTISRLLDLSTVHPEWRAPLTQAMLAMDEHYLGNLLEDGQWLPGSDRLLAAFRRDRANCRYILFGESPYPRRESANGIAFHDAAVTEVWSEKGLSKSVNRATSLRNIIKTALLAEGHLRADDDGRISQAAIAAIDKHGLILYLDELFDNLFRRGFLLLNATPVLHPQRKPLVEARAWKAFTAELLRHIADGTQPLPTLVLWGKIAETITALPGMSSFPNLTSEHPYNLSFIHNPDIQKLFAELKLLRGG